MSNEEIVKEIDEAMESLRETKRKIGGAFSKARNIVIKDSTVDTEAYNKGREEALQEVLNCESYGYEKGLNDAWELAQKIVCYEGDGGMSQRELEKIFDSFNTCEIMCLSYFEALAKLEAYEKANEIKVGDVVTIFPRSGGQYDAIVIMVNIENHINVIYADGVTADNVPPQLYKKTGKHIDLTDLFKQIGGE